MAKRDGGEQTGGKRVPVKLVGAGIAGVLAVVFLVQNNGEGTIEFLFFDMTTRVWVALLITLLLGVVIGFLVRGSLADKK